MAHFLFVVDATPGVNWGGAEKRYWELGSALARRGHRVTLVCPSEPPYEYEGSGGLVTLGLGLSPRLYRKGKRSLRVALAFARALSSALPAIGKVDLVDTTPFPFAHLPVLEGFCARHRIPLVITWHDRFGLDLALYEGRLRAHLISFLEGYAGRKRALHLAVSAFTARRLRDIGVQARIAPNGLDIAFWQEAWHRVPEVLERWEHCEREEARVGAFLMEEEDDPVLLMCPPGPLLRRVLGRGADDATDPVPLYPNDFWIEGISRGLPFYLSELRERAGERPVLWIGRLTRHKRPELALDTAREMRRSILAVVSGEWYGDLRYRRRWALEVRNLSDLGLAVLYGLAGALLHTGYYEGYGLSAWEGMLMGLPVVTARSPCSAVTSALSEPGAPGIVAEPEPSALARALLEVVAEPPPREEVRAWALARVVDWDRAAGLYLEAVGALT